MGRRQDVDQNQDEADVDNRSSTQTRTRTFSSETCGLAGIVYTSETSLTTNSERSSRSRRPRLTRKGSSGSYSVEERHTRPAQPLSNGNNHTGGASTGDSDSVESSMNEIDGVSTLDLVLRKRYSPSESHQMQHLEPARLEASRGILLDDAALKYLIDRGGHSSIACQRIMGGPSSEPDHSRSNRTMISSCSTVPDPPSLRQGSHYTVPGAFRIVFGGRSSSTNEDAESFVVSISSNINTGMASYDEAPAMVEASLVNDETFHDEECPPSSALSYCGVSMGERTLRTAATYHSTNATTIESPIVEALPIEGSPTVKECLRSRKMQYCLLHMIFLFSVLILGAAYGVRDYTNETPSLSYNATFQSDAPTSAPTSQGDMDLNYFIKVAVPSHTRLALREENSPQSKALKWLRNNTFLASYDIPRRLQRFALATFFFSTGGTREWKNKAGWLSDDDECTWFLSTSQYQDDNMEPCEMNVITRLSLAENKMKGTLPLEISLLNSLEVLEMRKNVLSGFLPTTLGEMNLLRVVDLFDNFLSGTVPPEIGNARSLEVLDIGKFIVYQVDLRGQSSKLY